MPTPYEQLQQVRPGQLIEAALMNRLVAAVLDLDQRVSGLAGENSHAPPSNEATITSINPPDEVAVGDELHVYGTNFGLLAGATQAFVGSTRITVFKAGSTNSHLIFDVPTLKETLPAKLAVVAGNQFSAQQRVLLVKPRPLNLVGSVTVELMSIDPAAIPANTDVFWEVKLTSQASRVGTFNISATVDQSAWQSGVRVLDSKTSTTSLSTVELTPQSPRTVFVKIPIPLGTGGAAFRLTISLDAPGGTAGGSAISPQYTVGVAGPETDPNVTLSAPVAELQPGTSWNGTTNTVTAPVGKKVGLTFDALLAASGDYDVTPAVSIATPGSWTITAGAGNPPNPITVTASQAAAGGVHQSLTFVIQAVAAAANGDTASVAVQRRTQSKVTTLTIQLKNA